MNPEDILTGEYWIRVIRFLGSVIFSTAVLSGVVLLLGKALVAFTDWLGLFLMIRKKDG